jgi:hypothetical protein
MGDVVEHHITRFALREEKVGPENFELLKVLGTGGTLPLFRYFSIKFSYFIPF